MSVQIGMLGRVPAFLSLLAVQGVYTISLPVTNVTEAQKWFYIFII